jgi:hypothetical protein
LYSAIFLTFYLNLKDHVGSAVCFFGIELCRGVFANVAAATAAAKSVLAAQSITVG